MLNGCTVTETESRYLDTVLEKKRHKRTDEVPLILHLTSHETKRPHVTWAEGTIDNEHLGRMKSNCCCIWVKPHVWDDSTTWEQDEYEVEHCRGHTLIVPPQPNKEIDGQRM
ncbi:Protein phosphatase inhibitor family protein [Acanthocheilonema viteae]|uniref:E3 ubiquitin-protein ligase PPP1R11 n=1 Tax=Acanthocheilonema viteae TaxID=6277 RepID=A0A498S338_ACAVI|nr:unnamed protein product [Acanthocheilonema viteae]